MNEIVNATGLSKGAFYHYFESKEKLFVEVINTFYFDKMVVDYNALNHNSLWDFYHDYVSIIKKSLLDFKSFVNFKDTDANINYFNMMFDALNLFPGFRNTLRETQKKELQAWTSVVCSAREKSEFDSPMSDEQIARMFIYSNDGIGLYLLLNGDVDNIDKEMLDLWDNFYRELKGCN